MTLRELAKIAGVNNSTVSRALRDDPQVSRRTALRIQKLARRHGYAPHPVVSQLMARLPLIRHAAAPTLAVVTAWPDWRRHRLLRAIHDGMDARARELGYRLEEFSLLSEGMSSLRLNSILIARNIEGVVACPFRHGPASLELDWGRFCGVAIGHSLAGLRLHRVTASYYDNMTLALRTLVGLGYRRIALAITPALSRRSDNAYLAAYSLYQGTVPAARRIPPFHLKMSADSWSEHTASRRESSVNMGMKLDAAKVAAWLRRHRADVLICNNTPDVRSLRAAGLRILGDVAYLTLDTHPADEGVSGFDLQPGKLGAATIDLVTAHVARHDHGIPECPKVLSLQSCWRPGKTAPPRKPIRLKEPVFKDVL